MAEIQNSEKLKERVSDWISSQKTKGKTQVSIANQFGTSTSYISGLSKMKESVGLNTIMYLLDFDKKLNARWLILGEGEMYPVYDINHDLSIFDEGKSQYVLSETIKKLVESKDEQIKILKDQIEFLKSLVEK